MVSKKRVGERFMQTRCAKYSEVIRVFIQDFLPIKKVTQEVVCEAASKHFFVPLWGEGSFEDIDDCGLNFGSAFVEAKTACNMSVV